MDARSASACCDNPACVRKRRSRPERSAPAAAPTTALVSWRRRYAERVAVHGNGLRFELTGLRIHRIEITDRVGNPEVLIVGIEVEADRQSEAACQELALRGALAAIDAAAFVNVIEIAIGIEGQPAGVDDTRDDARA